MARAKGNLKNMSLEINFNCGVDLNTGNSKIKEHVSFKSRKNFSNYNVSSV